MNLINSQLIRPDHLRNRLVSAWQYAQGKQHCRRPAELVCELTNACNANCIICPNAETTRKRGFMDVDLFRMIMTQCRPLVEHLDLSLNGEPLLHPKFDGILEICREKGIPTTICTNASLLTKQRSQQIIEAGIRAVTFSLDSNRPERFQKIRRNLNLHAVRENILGFLDLTLSRNKRPLSIAQMIIIPDNEDEMKDFKRFWKSKGIDRIRFKSYFNMRGMISDESTPSSSRIKCPILWRSFNVLWDGSVVACCFDQDRQLCVGDINQRSVLEIWNGTQIRYLRQMHAAGKARQLELCARCDAPHVGFFGSIGLALLDSLTLKEAIMVTEKLIQYPIFSRFRYSFSVFNKEPA